MVQQGLDESDQRAAVVHSVLHRFDCFSTLVQSLLLLDSISFGSVELLFGYAGVALAVDALERLVLVYAYLLCLNPLFELEVKCETSDLLERFVIHRSNTQNLAFIDCITAEDFGLRVGQPQDNFINRRIARRAHQDLLALAAGQHVEDAVDSMRLACAGL